MSAAELFSVAGKSVLVTGATGAFGRMAATGQVLYVDGGYTAG